MNSKAVLTLNNGVKIPVIGFGTWLVKGTAVQNAVKWAIEAGYRHIDTARKYDNERDIGKTLKEINIPRNELFITTKLWYEDHGYQSTIDACNASLKRLGLDYLDLYIIHWPGTTLANNDKRNKELRMQTWKAMEQLQSDGKCKAIGVSNYTIDHLKELMANSKVKPAVNQVEFHPYLYQKELLEFCKQHDIVIEAYSPLAHGEIVKEKKIQSISSKYNKTPAQLLIRWCIQHNLVVIPKSVSKERIRENINVFDFTISDEDMQILNGMNKNFRSCWDPTDIL